MTKNTHAKYKTYNVGLLQAQVYRRLRIHFSNLLAEHNLTLSEWAFIGVLCEKNKLKIGDMAQLLDVKPSFATRLSHALENKGFIKKKNVVIDQRTTVIQITPEGKKKASGIEKELQIKLQRILSNIDISELIVYIRVLEKLAKL